MTSKLKSLPIGIQTFEIMIKSQKLYVDKTALVYDLIKAEETRYFLSRPRRFGKSSLLSTLESFFQGKKELFKDLAIEKMTSDWEEYPVIRLDISQVGSHNEKMVIEGLIQRLIWAAEPFELNLNISKPPHEVFIQLIKLIVKKTGKKVVVLIDEYDSPIVNQLHDHQLVKRYFEILKDFYQVTKSLDTDLRFVFVTGVSNFAKVNMFSGLNHLDNITMNSQYSEICGYTQQELEYYFSDRIDLLSKKRKQTKAELLKIIKEWYNGYQFSENSNTLYNPFSILQLFNNQTFRNYWYQTGTPSFLVKAIGNTADLQPEQFENYKAYLNDFDTLAVEKPDVLPLLFQAGYLTIKNFDEKAGVYGLGYPNQEVRDSFLKSLLVYYSDNSLSTAHIIELRDNLRENDIDAFMQTMQIFFATIPYDIQIQREKYYQTIFYLVFMLLGYSIQVEVRTNKGRIDAVLEIDSIIYIIEFKLNGTAEEALKQIHLSDYPTKYRKPGKKLILIGVEFNSDERNIKDWKIEHNISDHF